MRKGLRLLAAVLAAFVCSLSAWAQNIRVAGQVTSSPSGENVGGVSVRVKNMSIGTSTDSTGHFQVAVPSLPIRLVFSSIGYETQEVVVSSAATPITVSFVPSNIIGQEVVVSASRLPQRILEAPVTIERVSAATIRTAPVSNYYDIVTNLKGVDAVLSSLTFRTPTTRGFSGSGNLRFNQIVDGMDNQAPGLNFSVGSVIGLTELDVESMELLPGATSALYGPGGMNGTLLINSKSPFRYPGLSLQVKTGAMHFDDKDRDVSAYHNYSLRWAQKVSEKFAYKIGGEYIRANDWLARDYRNYKRFGTTGEITAGTLATDPNYDGVNVYGDETSIDLRTRVLNNIAVAVPFLAGYINTLPGSIPVSRTGYTENEVVDPKTINFKLSGSLNYKLGKDMEAIFSGYWGTGNTVYTGSQRYSLKDLKVGQYKLELNAKNWFVRGYTTQENAGESHNLTITTQLFNEAWKPSTTWYQEYAFAYLNAKQAGRPDLEAHNLARATADQGRPVAGSPEFKRIFDSVRKVPIPRGGLFLDRSDLWMAEGQYNFSNVIKFAEVLVGGNWKQYVLNSEGTLFADTKGSPIKINEFGSYIQVGREVIKDRLKLTASGRYDKNENFKGRFTPRFTAVVKPATDQNIRLSYQTAYRFPSTQQQWIDLDVGTGRLLGANRALYEKYDLINNPGYTSNIFTNPAQAERVPYVEIKPEAVTSYEFGYKGLFAKKLLIDIYYYTSNFKDFITRRDVVQFPGGTPGATFSGYSLVANSPEKVETHGGGGSIEYVLPKNFVVSGSLTSDVIKNVPAGFRAFFNSPKWRSMLTLSNTGFGPNKKFGANVSWRWQDGFFYENDFTQGDLPAFHTLDAAINYKSPKLKSIIKLGATNLLNQYYRTAVGNPSIGGLYYLSFAYNVL
ncbi:TonB-dependent receptor [Flavisolibacter nicotianae]|uniref:TonB-dependent receptor n=1 Tax=Flavisolibacter nicotianae TaxID=2364882 RepID=UPI000EB3772D|nr:TonB-dependent receptor [Flavisolibacter nicotianae]